MISSCRLFSFFMFCNTTEELTTDNYTIKQIGEGLKSSKDDIFQNVDHFLQPYICYNVKSVEISQLEKYEDVKKWDDFVYIEDEYKSIGENNGKEKIKGDFFGIVCKKNSITFQNNNLPSINIVIIHILTPDTLTCVGEINIVPILYCRILKFINIIVLHDLINLENSQLLLSIFEEFYCRFGCKSLTGSFDKELLKAEGLKLRKSLDNSKFKKYKLSNSIIDEILENLYINVIGPLYSPNTSSQIPITLLCKTLTLELLAKIYECNDEITSTHDSKLAGKSYKDLVVANIICDYNGSFNNSGNNTRFNFDTCGNSTEPEFTTTHSRPINRRDLEGNDRSRYAENQDQAPENIKSSAFSTIIKILTYGSCLVGGIFLIRKMYSHYMN